MMEADLPVQMMRSHLVRMKQKPRRVLMSKSQLAQMELSLHVLTGQRQEDLAVLMDPNPHPAQMEMLLLALMVLRSHPVQMERNQDVLKEPALYVRMELHLDKNGNYYQTLLYTN